MGERRHKRKGMEARFEDARPTGEEGLVKLHARKKEPIAEQKLKAIPPFRKWNGAQRFRGI